MDDALVERMARAVDPAGFADPSAAHNDRRKRVLDAMRAALAVAEPDLAALRAERDALQARVEALEGALRISASGRPANPPVCDPD